MCLGLKTLIPKHYGLKALSMQPGPTDFERNASNIFAVNYNWEFSIGFSSVHILIIKALVNKLLSWKAIEHSLPKL